MDATRRSRRRNDVLDAGTPFHRNLNVALRVGVRMKLTVIGAGTIGAGVAYNVAIRGVVDDIVVVDLDEERATGEALDIAHATAMLNDTEVRQGGYDDAAGSDIVAVTAGKPRKEGMTRLDLLEANAGVMQAVHEHDFGEDAVFVTTTNPMDVINYTHSLVSDYPRERFVGFGGWLDSARLRYILSRHRDVPADSIAGWVIGEHGDSQVPVFSRVTVDGDPVDLPEDEQDVVVEQARQSAMDVISRKGGTEWAPTYGVAEIIEAIATDSGCVIPCSAILDGEYGYTDVSIGVPVRLGRSGIKEVVEWELSQGEREAFNASAERLQELCTEVPGLL